jgi:hypothetical protein
MDECEYCGVKYEAPEMIWTENMKDLACNTCHDILLSIKEYKSIFKVEYVIPKQFPMVR